MKIAIHHKENSFSEFWIEYCQFQNIPYKIVDGYQSDIIEQLKECNALMWPQHQGHIKDILAAKRILYSLEHAGVKVFPNFHTAWHFDDKVAQKYLLESIGAPLVSSYVFYEKNLALEWAVKTTYPKVFKLKGGAGSANVKLVRTKSDAFKLIDKSFSKGFSQFDRLEYLKERYRKYKSGQDTLIGVAKGLGRLLIPTAYAKWQSREKGYVYFQEFMPDNLFDIRVIVIGDKAFAIKRLVRKNDFRASGSGSIVYVKDEIDIRCVKIAFETSAKLQTQCLAYDFVFDHEKTPKIVEISYGFSSPGYVACPGYWDAELIWHEGAFNPYGWMVDLVLDK